MRANAPLKLTNYFGVAQDTYEEIADVRRSLQGKVKDKLKLVINCNQFINPRSHRLEMGLALGSLWGICWRRRDPRWGQRRVRSRRHRCTIIREGRTVSLMRVRVCEADLGKRREKEGGLRNGDSSKDLGGDGDK